MHILVNGMPLTGLLTGIGRYVRSLYSCLEAEPTVRVDYSLGRRTVPVMPARNSAGSSLLRKRPQGWQPPSSALCAYRIAHWLWCERCLRRDIANGGGYRLYHETGFFPPDIGGSLPVVQTVYDLSLRRYAHTHPRDRVCYYEFFIKRRLRHATHLLAISEYVRQEILDEFKLPLEMVTTVPLAPDPRFSPRPEAQVAAVLDRLGVPSPYILFAGTLEPRKNLKLLIDALPLMRHDIPLVLAGWSGWGDKAWLERLDEAGLARRVILSGYVDDEELTCLYSGATALVYPSLYEGFGLPVLEAMACGCPVVCSRTSCLPETAGEAALLVDPHDPEELAGILDRLVESETVRQSLREQGLARAALFTWEKTARQTLAVFQRVCDGR